MRFWLPVFLLAIAAPGAWAQDISTDRPDFSNSTSVVPPRTIQVEVGVGRSSVDDVDTDQLLVSLIRVSLANPIELRFGWAGLNRLTRGDGDTISGSGDISFGAKLRLRGEGRILPSMALIGTYTLPSGDDAFRAREDIPELALALGWSLGRNLGMTVNLGGFWSVNEPGNRTRTGFYSVSLSRAAYSYSVYLEAFGFFTPSAIGDAQSLDFGLLYPVLENLQIDVFLGGRLSGAAPDAFFGAGLSVRLPR